MIDLYIDKLFDPTAGDAIPAVKLGAGSSDLRLVIYETGTRDPTRKRSINTQMICIHSYFITIRIGDR